MGAQSFYTVSKGKTPQAAFRAAVKEAQWECGHGGYTGTIAEKETYTMIDLPQGVLPNSYSHQLIKANDPRVNDKWGPAGCIALGDNTYLFFGCASS